jgi:predicted nucleotidyltransferase
MVPLPPDFRDFLKLLNQHKVEYLLIGGYAVAFHGYVRYTGDMDIFVKLNSENAARLRQVLIDFGFPESAVPQEIFEEKGRIIRMGVPPMRLEILNKISGITFEECYENRTVQIVEDVPINFINLDDLKKNKAASGRTKDINDLENLP